MKVQQWHQEPGVPLDGESAGATTGNVRVLDHRDAPSPAGRERSLVTATLATGDGGWSIVDCDDRQVGPPLASRSEALRKIGMAALQGAAMPLTVRGPDGRPTGDRLA